VALLLALCATTVIASELSLQTSGRKMLQSRGSCKFALTSAAGSRSPSARSIGSTYVDAAIESSILHSRQHARRSLILTTGVDLSLLLLGCVCSCWPLQLSRPVWIWRRLMLWTRLSHTGCVSESRCCCSCCPALHACLPAPAPAAVLASSYSSVWLCSVQVLPPAGTHSANTLQVCTCKNLLSYFARHFWF